MSAFKLTLVEKPSPHALERTPRYSVRVNGQEVDELYHNMTGYRGGLMTIHGQRVDIGERGISAWRREMARLNREARAVLAASEDDPERLQRWAATANGDVMALTFARDGFKSAEEAVTLRVPRRALMAGHELLGTPGLGKAFFKDVVLEEEVEPLVPFETLKPFETWDQPRFVLAILETTDPTQNVVISGQVPAITGKVIAGDVAGAEVPSDWDIANLAAAIEGIEHENWAAGVIAGAFVPEDIVASAVEANGRAFMRAERLPGHGIFSPSPKAFAPMVTSNGQRPEIVLDEAQSAMFGAFLASRGAATISKADYQADLDHEEHSRWNARESMRQQW